MLKKIGFVLFLIVSISFSLVSCKDSEDDGMNSGEVNDVVDDDGERGESNGAVDDNAAVNDNTDKTEGGAPSEGAGNTGAENDSDETNREESEGEMVPEVNYVYSLNSKKYHLPNCYHATSLKPETKVEFSGTLDEISDLGYYPCKVCKPDPNYDYEQSSDSLEGGEATDGYEYEYILNNDSKKFHHPGCSSANSMNEENKEYSNETREYLMEQGYSPCGKCKP